MPEFERSPVARDPNEIPDIPFAELLLEKVKLFERDHASKPWLVNVVTGHTILFGEIEEKSRKLSSAFTRTGLKRGDTLYYVTYDATYIYLVWLAAWRIGVAVRGCTQRDEPGEYERQMREGNVLVALIDNETAPTMVKACQALEWKVNLINLGPENVENAISFSELLQDDGSAYPAQVTDLITKDDVIFIANTSGSTGQPKGAMHTQRSCVATVYGLVNKVAFCGNQLDAASICLMEWFQQCDNLVPINPTIFEKDPCRLVLDIFSPVTKQSQFAVGGNFGVSNFMTVTSSIYNGFTLYLAPRLIRENYINQLMQWKPDGALMYPYLASWFVRDPELPKHDLSFLKGIAIVGAVLDPTTADLLSTNLPNTMVFQGYAMSEVSGITMSMYGIEKREDAKRPRTCEFEGKLYVTSGKPFPYSLIKIVDSNSGQNLGRTKSGEILVKGPHVMKGYLVHNGPPNTTGIDKDGWLHTGDMGFLDENGFLYIQDRKSFLYKYYMDYVSPCDIESVLTEHPAIREAVVIGIPNSETTNLSRAYIVLKPGLSASEDEIKKYIAERLQPHMHLHGGVRFTDSLPVNRGGKVDRIKLREMASHEKAFL